MSDLVFEEDGLNYELLLGAFRGAVALYEEVLASSQIDHGTIEAGAVGNSGVFKNLRPVILKNCLLLPNGEERSKACVWCCKFC